MRVLSKSRSKLGECPVWDDRSQRLFWVDIEAGKLFAATLEGEETAWVLPERIGSFGLTTSTQAVVLALESGFAVYDLETSKLDRIPMPHKLGELVRFNDGKCDAHGNFWAGTMSEAVPRRSDAHLYRLRPDLRVDTMRSGIKVSNSLAWSVDGTRMYFADSPTKTILAYAHQENAAGLGAPEVFVGAAAFRGVPDGSTIDADNWLWTAEWDGWRVIVHDEEGRLMRDVPVPAQRPTSCCFGGPDFSTLFITTALADGSPNDDEKQPDAGRVLVIDRAGRGKAAARFVLA